MTRQAIELATSVSSAFVSDADSDGLVGLAFSTLNSVSPRPQKTFFDNIMSELAQPVFTAALDLDGSGTYEFGTIDASKFTGNLMFTLAARQSREAMPHLRLPTLVPVFSCLTPRLFRHIMLRFPALYTTAPLAAMFMIVRRICLSLQWLSETTTWPTSLAQASHSHQSAQRPASVVSRVIRAATCRSSEMFCSSITLLCSTESRSFWVWPPRPSRHSTD